MKTQIFKAESRGRSDYGWLHATYSFSFGQYYDPNRLHFGHLKVLNDDIIEPGKGFGTHPHNNMEIISIPLKGKLAHKDSTGHESILTCGDIQVMSAGSGITHSEYNGSNSDICNLLQIWIEPKIQNTQPQYAEKKFNWHETQDLWVTIASGFNDHGAIAIGQDAAISLACLKSNTSLDYTLKKKGNKCFIMAIDGSVMKGNEILNRRDAIGLNGVITTVSIQSQIASQILLIEVP